MKELNNALIAVQSQLVAKKDERNTFGKYSYRTAEGILAAAKPLLAAEGLTMRMSDSIAEMGGMVIVTAEVTISNGIDSVSSTASAGVDPNTKGMSIGQCFGSSSSYARKYALNGILLIDDSKLDPDTQDNSKKVAFKPIPNAKQIESMKKAVESGNTDAVAKALNDKYDVSDSLRKDILG